MIDYQGLMGAEITVRKPEHQAVAQRIESIRCSQLRNCRQELVGVATARDLSTSSASTPSTFEHLSIWTEVTPVLTVLDVSFGHNTITSGGSAPLAAKPGRKV